MGCLPGGLAPENDRGNYGAARGVRSRVLLTVAVAWLAACSGERVLGDYPPSSCDLAEPPQQFERTPLAIATFWEADTKEAAALEVLTADVDDERYLVWPQKMRTRVEVQQQMKEAFEQQQLPDVFQVNGGSDVLRWVQQRESDSTDVCALDRLRDLHGWRDAYFSSALEPLTCQGNLYGLPVGIHHLNVMFYNRQVFAQLAELANAQGVELLEPSTLHDAYELLAQLELVAGLGAKGAGGEPLTLLAIGRQSEWPLTIIAFENVLLSLAQAAYETLWMGGLAGEQAGGERAAELESKLREMLVVLRSLAGFANVNAELGWQEALHQVGRGDALMTITGDWGWAQLEPEMMGSVATTTFPGTAGTFVYTPDSFAVPRELNKNGFPARSFLHDVVEDKTTLIDFSNKKFSIPPRRDLSPDELASLSTDSLRDTYREFTRCSESDGCELLLAVSGLGPAPGTDPCFDEMDAVLQLAVLNVAPDEAALKRRTCREPFPSSSANAEERLIELLLGVAERSFAADCR